MTTTGVILFTIKALPYINYILVTYNTYITLKYIMSYLF